MGPKAGPDAMAKRYILWPCKESNHGRPTRSLVSILTELSQFPSKHPVRISRGSVSSISLRHTD